MSQTQALATIPSEHTLARHDGALLFTAEQEQLIRDSFASGASPQEFQVLIAVAKARRLNPLLRQIHFVKRWDGQKNRDVWSTQVSIDGMRAIAERTGKYDGQDEPEYEYDAKGGLKLARIKVYRRDWSRPAVGVALFAEYAQTKRDGGLTQFWREKPHIMLAKCAEALAMRKAFPEDTAGLYVPEEMGDSEQPQRARPGRNISPHADADENIDAPSEEPATFERLKAAIDNMEQNVESCSEHDRFAVAALREVVGSQRSMSPWLKEFQAVRERQSVTVDQRKLLSQTWHRVNRKLSKLEAALPKPDAVDSFTDPPDEEPPSPEDDGRA